MNAEHSDHDGPAPSSDPRASKWLASVLASRPQTMRVATGGSAVELLVWGERGRPGLFLLHGARAHWWDGVAPLLARDHLVAAMTLPGNGGSGWRGRYACADIFREFLACVAVAVLDDAGPPLFAGHSMGGAHLMHGAIHPPETIRGLVLLDTSSHAPGRDQAPAPGRTRHLFVTEAEALARFRLAPPGPAREPALVEHVARHAMIRVDGPDGDPPGLGHDVDRPDAINLDDIFAAKLGDLVYPCPSVGT